MSDKPIASAWFTAVEAIAARVGTPLPNELITFENDEWRMAMNNTRETVTYEGQDLDPFHIVAMNKTYIIIAVVAPHGGAIGGMPEDEFIYQMKVMAEGSTR